MVRVASEGAVSRQTTIGEIVKAHPDAAPIILSYGLHCIGCHIGLHETLEQGCRAHGLPEEVIDELVEELNESVKGKKEGE